MSDVVLDASALLALLFAEPGAEAVAAVLADALISSVNLAEVASRLTDRGVPEADARAAIAATGVRIVEFDSDQAWEAARLRGPTRAAGLSLGDRACLALARTRSLPALTGDRAWTGIAGVEVVLIR